MIECRNCGYEVDGEKFCHHCGHSLLYERITLRKVFHEVLETYTHLEKGFLYAIRQLAIHPGTMQKNYLEGIRRQNQKPFPLFVICGTICALALYFTNKPYTDATQQYFFRNYYVVVQALMLPVYALITWLFFYNSRLYYAEVLILTVYMIGFMLLIVIPVNIFHFAFDTVAISYIEMILLAGYNVWTNLNFFSNKRKWVVIIKSLAIVFISYMLFQFVAVLFIRLMK